MNPYAVLMMARTLEQDRERTAAERRPIHRPETTPRREPRDSWAAISASRASRSRTKQLIDRRGGLSSARDAAHP
jgi:hypothetical protein